MDRTVKPQNWKTKPASAQKINQVCSSFPLLCLSYSAC